MKLINKALIGLGALGAGYGLYRAGRNALAYPSLEHFDVHGFVEPGFEPVREAFIDNFRHRSELGGAVCVYRDGQKVVDLWGGFRDRSTMEPWQEDTMVVVYSTTKGLAAMTLALANSRGLIDYDERVAAYWPEFAQNGKESITVRQLLAHQAGLFAFDEPVDKETVRDLDRLAEILARARPAWDPGTRQGYHAISLGFYEGELIRRVDPMHRSLGHFFLDEIAQPLGLDFHIRLPNSIPNSRLAVIESPNFMKLLQGFPIRLTLDSLNSRSNIYRALAANPGSAIVHDDETVYSRDLEVPSGGGVGTAEAIAHAYGEFASGGKVLGLRQRTLEALASPAVEPSTLGFYDECMRGEAKFSLGFMKPCEAWPFHEPTAYGHPGAGGSIGFADPEAHIGFAYVTNRMGTSLSGDPREIALRNALYSCAPITSPLPAGTMSAAA
jgi:CubicO group peptidase (beta-lactamase class C family)